AQQWTPNGIRETDLEETYRNYHLVETLGEDRWLLVCARAADDRENNAFIYDSSGNRVHSFAVGDGVEDVQAAQDEYSIWVSYFDEGVYSGGILGAEGVVCFTADGVPAFRYRSEVVERAPHFAPSIDDCYAMNVGEDGDVWLYYYTDFPLVRLHQKQIKAVWANTFVSGSHAFAVSDDRVLFSGSYHEKDQLHLLHLYSGTTESETIVPVDEDGNPIVSADRIFARGSRLYLLRQNDLFVLDLNLHL
ncbi:MAG: hypothetical protein V4671_16585, partial [Armatimonadota bacterium]